tara:strand:+ start:959 stop:1189 length:231 start_codon:yes stop_codon:yes gene_type:complete
MIKLHPETAQAIATLITSIDVARIMKRDCGFKKEAYWMADEYRAIIQLVEEYGIPHNCYDIAIKGMKKDLFANATL